MTARRLLPPGCSDRTDGYLATLDRSHLPRWSDAEAVLDLFRDEEMGEWSALWPWHDDEPGEVAAPGQKRGRGRPKGVKMSKARREARWPIHRAATMVPLAEAILRDLYPDQPRHETRDRALIVVEHLWNRLTHQRERDRITVSRLALHLARARKDRRRV